MLVILPLGNLAARIDRALQVTDYVFSAEEIAEAAVHYINGDVDCALDQLFRKINALDEAFVDLPYNTPSDQVLKKVIGQVGREINTNLFNLYHDVCIPHFVSAGEHQVVLTVDM